MSCHEPANPLRLLTTDVAQDRMIALQGTGNSIALCQLLSSDMTFDSPTYTQTSASPLGESDPYDDWRAPCSAQHLGHGSEIKISLSSTAATARPGDLFQQSLAFFTPPATAVAAALADTPFAGFNSSIFHPIRIGPWAALLHSPLHINRRKSSICSSTNASRW